MRIVAPQFRRMADSNNDPAGGTSADTAMKQLPHLPGTWHVSNRRVQKCYWPARGFEALPNDFEGAFPPRPEAINREVVL